MYTLRRSRAGSGVLMLAMSLSAWATPIPLDGPPTLGDLIAQQGTVQLGDQLLVSNFTCTVTGPAKDSVDPFFIPVMEITEGNSRGLSFGPTLTHPAFGAPIGYVDVVIGFDIAVINPAEKIVGIDLGFEPLTLPGQFAQVVESALVGTQVVGQMQVQSPSPLNASMDLGSGGYDSLRIYKDIFVLAGPNGGAVDVVTQMFHQVVPEPATLLAFGLCSLIALGRRRVRTAGTVMAIGLAALLIQPQSASAANLSLQDLIDNPLTTIVVGDLEFSNFGVNPISSAGEVLADPAQIDVLPITLGGEDGIQFAGLFAALSNITADSRVTLDISYDVMTLNTSRLLHDMSLSFNGATTASDGLVRVAEMALVGGSGVGSITVETPGGPLSGHTTFTDDAAYQTLSIGHRIIVDGGAAGVSTISFINETFSQLPEPAAITLLAMALPMFLLRRSRRH